MNPSPIAMSLNLRVRGLEVRAQGGEGGVIHLIVCADKKDGGPFGRFAQNIANALYRAADVLHPRDYDERGINGVQLRMSGHSGDDPLPDVGDADVFQCWPIKLANGDASYEVFAVYEGIEGHQQDPVSFEKPFFGSSCQGCTDHAHSVSPAVVVDEGKEEGNIFVATIINLARRLRR